jgi:hypothetical protein
MVPNDIRQPRQAANWVFTVDESPWLAERHHYEVARYSTPLLDTHQHYTFAFHDEFVEAIAGGIWFDVADSARPFARPDQHPLARLDPGTDRERFRSPSGIEWALRRAARGDADLVRDSRLCSQRIYQINLLLDGHSSEGASIWLRTRNGRTVSRLVRPWPGGEVAQREGIAKRRAVGDVPHGRGSAQTRDGPLGHAIRTCPAPRGRSGRLGRTPVIMRR